MEGGEKYIPYLVIFRWEFFLFIYWDRRRSNSSRQQLLDLRIGCFFTMTKPDLFYCLCHYSLHFVIFLISFDSPTLINRSQVVC